MPNGPADEGEDLHLIVICKPVMADRMKSIEHTYTFNNIDEMPCTLAYLYTDGLYACDHQAMMYAWPERPHEPTIFPLIPIN